MNEIAQFFLPAIAVVALLLGVAAVYLLWVFKGILSELRDVIPDKALVRGLTATQNSLDETLGKEKKVIQNLPLLLSNTVSTQVSSGLEPLRGEISKSTQSSIAAIAKLTSSLHDSHQEFQNALLTVNDDGHFKEWITALRETVAPMQVAGAALENHYATADSILKSNTRFIADWSGRWGELASHLEQFSTDFNRWFTDEQISRGQIEQRIMNRLEEVNETNVLVGESLNELQSSGAKLLGSNHDLTMAMTSLKKRVDELGQKHEALISLQRDLLQAHEKVQRDFHISQENIMAASKTHQEQFGSYVLKTGTVVSEMVSRVDRELSKMGVSYAAQLNELLSGIKKQQVDQQEFIRSLQQGQQALLESSQKNQQKTMESVRKALDLISSQKLQKFALVVQIGILFSIIGCAYVLQLR